MNYNRSTKCGGQTFLSGTTLKKFGELGEDMGKLR
jgi:hypothetical protein